MLYAKRALLLISLLIAVLGAFFVAPSPARSQGGNCDYARFWDFGAGDLTGWTITTGSATSEGVEAVVVSGVAKVLDMELMCDAPIGNPRRFQFAYWTSHGWTAPRPYNLYLLDEDGVTLNPPGAIGQGSGAPGEYTYEYSGDWSTVYGFRIYYERGTSESFIVRSWEINHTTPVGTSTPGPTNTATNTPTPWATYPAVSFPYPVCTTFTQQETFLRGGRWVLNNADQEIDGVMLHPGGGVSITAPINPALQYKLHMKWTNQDEAEDQLFNVLIGAAPLDLPIPDNETDRLFAETRLGNLVPFGDSYPLIIGSPPTNTIDILLEYACLIPESQAAIVPPPAEVDPNGETCFECDNRLTIYIGNWDTGVPDPIAIVGWLWCNLRRVLECWLLFILRRIFEFVAAGVVTVIGLGKFFFDVVGGGAAFLSSLALGGADWAASAFRNLTAQIGTGIIESGVGDVANHISRAVNDLPTALFNLFGGALSDAYNIVNNGRDLGSIIIGLIGVVIRAVADFIGLFPLVVQSLIDGFNAASLPLNYTPACSNPNDFFYAPCLGLYILDNTIFSGPAFYLIPILMGLFAFHTFIWIITKVQNAFR